MKLDRPFTRILAVCRRNGHETNEADKDIMFVIDLMRLHFRDVCGGAQAISRKRLAEHYNSYPRETLYSRLVYLVLQWIKEPERQKQARQRLAEILKEA